MLDRRPWAAVGDWRREHHALGDHSHRLTVLSLASLLVETSKRAIATSAGYCFVVSGQVVEVYLSDASVTKTGGACYHCDVVETSAVVATYAVDGTKTVDETKAVYETNTVDEEQTKMEPVAPCGPGGLLVMANASLALAFADMVAVPDSMTGTAGSEKAQ